MKKILLSLAVAAAVMSVAPAAEAQFGGLGKLGKLKGAVDKAKAAKDKADSAKAMLEAAKAAKGALTGAAAAMTTVTEANFAQFGKGIAAEKASWTAKPGDAEAAVKAATEASGLEYKDYNNIKAKVAAYYASTKGGQADLNIVSADETKILDAHKVEIAAWVESGWPGAATPEKK